MKEFFEDKKEVKVDSGTMSGLLIFWLIFILFWVVTGIAAFVASLVCFAFYGSVTSKTLGFVIAFLFGPFYWFYFIFNSKYCTRSPIEDEF
jgi:hypothetical protein